MRSTILVPLDGSALAEQALPCAERIARRVLGSPTTGTLQHAGVPLLIVRPTELQPVPEPHAALVKA